MGWHGLFGSASPIGRQIWTNQTAYDVIGVVADYMSSPVESRLAVRIAIGADRGHQIRLVMAHSVRLVLLGSALGVALTFGLSRLVRAAGGAGTLYDPPWPAFSPRW